jgi:hypothetical protein
VGGVQDGMGIRSRHPHRLAIWLLLVAGLFLGACAQTSTGNGGASGGTATTLGPPSSSAPPSTSAPGKGTGQVVVRGTLRKGVEPGCLLLDGQDKHAYLLLDGPQGQLQAGSRVEVVGQPVDQIASFCGEGSTLSVVSVRQLK